MATSYDYPITLEFDGVDSLDYSYVAPSSTYTGSTLGMYFKAGDTIGNTITNPSGGNIGDVAANTAADPDPDNSGAQAPGTKYYAVTSSSTAWATTTWLIFGRNTSSGNPADRSNRFWWQRVSGTISLDSTTITRGSNLTGSVSQTGLQPPGTNSHRLYLKVWNSATTADWTYVNGGSLASVTSSSTSFSLSTASNMPCGTYELVLTHYAPSGSNSGSTYQTNNYWGRNQQLHSINFTVQRVRSYPDQFELGTGTTSAATSTDYASSAITITGIGSGQTATVTISGGSYKIGSGSYTTGSSTISNNQTVTVKVTSSSQLSTQTTATLTITGEDVNCNTVSKSDTWQVTTASSGDTTPDVFTFSPDTYTGVAIQGLITSNEITVAGLGSGQTAAISASGTGNSHNAAWTKDDGTNWNTSAGTVVNGDDVKLRFNASTVNNQANTGTLTIGGVSDTITATTVASGSGSVVGGISGTDDYGLEVRNGSNVLIFSPNFRSGHLVDEGSVSVADGSSANITHAEIVAGADINCIVYWGATAVPGLTLSVTRTNVSGGSGYFTVAISNIVSANVTFAVKYWLVRY